MVRSIVVSARVLIYDFAQFANPLLRRLFHGLVGRLDQFLIAVGGSNALMFLTRYRTTNSSFDVLFARLAHTEPLFFPELIHLILHTPPRDPIRQPQFRTLLCPSHPRIFMRFISCPSHVHHLDRHAPSRPTTFHHDFQVVCGLFPSSTISIDTPRSIMKPNYDSAFTVPFTARPRSIMRSDLREEIAAVDNSIRLHAYHVPSCVPTAPVS